jgi:hypothetical protein
LVDKREGASADTASVPSGGAAPLRLRAYVSADARHLDADAASAAWLLREARQ